MTEFLDSAIAIGQVLVAIAIGISLFFQILPLMNPRSCERVLEKTLDHLIHGTLVHTGLTHAATVFIGWLILGPLASSLMVFVYCVEWAKIQTVLNRKRR